MIRTILCWIGWHKWETYNLYEHGKITGYMRCKNPECPRYRRWFVGGISDRWPW